MKTPLLLLTLIALFLTGCSDGKKSASVSVPDDLQEEPADTIPTDIEEDGDEEDLDHLIGTQPMPVAADELFDDFIFNFASNRRLQMERINFPLSIDGDTTTLEDSTSVVAFSRDNWQMEHFFMHEGEYTLMFDSPEEMELVKDTSVSQVTVEHIMLNENTVKQYLFDRTGGQWRLTGVRRQTLAENPNASFIGFYQQFATDSAFQRESLSEAIDIAVPDPDDDFAQTEGVITPDFWDAFAPELPEGIVYNIVYGPQDAASDQKVFVVRGISNGLELELTFKRRDGRWKLTKMSE